MVSVVWMSRMVMRGFELHMYRMWSLLRLTQYLYDSLSGPSSYLMSIASSAKRNHSGLGWGGWGCGRAGVRRVARVFVYGLGVTNAAFVARVAELEAENLVLRGRVEEQDLVIAAQAEQIVLLLAQVERLVAKITILEALLNADSSNSSRRPSSDDDTAKNKRAISNSRKRRDGEPKRAQGKQRGAPG